MTFQEPAIDRLALFLNTTPDNKSIERLTPDASTREFFRISFEGVSAIACVYPDPIDQTLPQLDVTSLFLKCGLPVARIIKTAYNSGIVVHEDFGDIILRDVLAGSDSRDSYLDSAIRLIARIQAGTEKAFELNSIASRLKFDREKLLWELDFFKTHYFTSLNRRHLPKLLEETVVSEFSDLATELESYAAVLTHRDFHSANLMLLKGELKIIDHQDARIGPASYDLVSLLLDRIETPPTDVIIKHWKELLQRYRSEEGLPQIEGFDYEFDLVTIQRCLKAIGTFSNQAANFGKTRYLKYINPMFLVVSRACSRLGRFENIRLMVENEIQED